MKVYVLEGFVEYYDSWIIGTYTKKEEAAKAKIYYETAPEEDNVRYSDGYTIIEQCILNKFVAPSKE